MPPTHDVNRGVTGSSHAGATTERKAVDRQDGGEESRSLRQLLGASGAERESAFAELYERTQARVHAVAVRALRSIDHAREVVQDTYLEAWLRAGSYDPARGTVEGWLGMIAYRRAVDRIRLVESSRARDESHAGLHHALRPVDIGDEVASKLDAQLIRPALMSLNPIHREAVLMKYVEGHTMIQMAAMLALPLGTVKTRVRDGRTAIQQFSTEWLGRPIDLTR